MRVSRAANLSLLLLGGCFWKHTTHTCEELSRDEVALDEDTPSGTAADLLASVATDGVFPGAYPLDGSPVDVELWLDQDGPAHWVEVETVAHVGRSFGIGSSHVAFEPWCPSRLELAIAAEARTSDGELEVFATGTAHSYGVDLHGSYADATFPASEHDPSDYHDRYSFIDLDVDSDGVVGGAVGWVGERETEDYRSVRAERVVEFGLEPIATTTPEEP